MSDFTLIQTEKSYRLQQSNVYTIVFTENTFNPNKIELHKLLVSKGYTPLSISITNQFSKKKQRGKKRNLVSQIRPKKYFVKLKEGQKIETSKN